jgi:hypothetical protein
MVRDCCDAVSRPAVATSQSAGGKDTNGMRHFRTLLMTGAAVALLGAALSAPVSAANAGKLTFVQGQPRTKIDICVGNSEIVSNLAYGKYKARLISAGNKVVRFAKAAPGTCSGAKVATLVRNIGVGDNTTVVLTRFAPKLVIFDDNNDFPPGAGFGRILMRHAADLGAAGFKYTTDDGVPWLPIPTADSPFTKGQWGGGNFSADTRMIWWVHLPPDQTAIAGPVELVVEDGVRHEYILVGTTAGNARFLRIDSNI